MSAVRLAGVSKRFRLRRGWREALRAPRAARWLTALDAVSLEVREGEFFGLLGQNGAGKSTLFRILSTLLVPDAGAVAVDGVDALREPGTARRRVATVLANERSLYWRLDARENLRLHAALHRLPSAEAERRIDDLLGVLRLAGTDRRLVGTFSSGMRQRLLLARALVARPRVLLLDEPTRSLDPVSARDFRAFLREELGRARGCTVLLATHDPEEVRDLCDRVGVLHAGRLLAAGTTDALVRDVAEPRWRLWTRAPSHPALAALAARPAAGDVAVEAGWHALEFEAPGGTEAAAATLGGLVAAGVPVGRFEPSPLTLAELIERVAARDRAHA